MAYSADIAPRSETPLSEVAKRAAKGFDIRHNTVRVMLKSDNGARERST